MSAGGNAGAFDADKHFPKVLDAEHLAISERRTAHGRDKIKPDRVAEALQHWIAGKDRPEVPTSELPAYDTVGVALSGGGIRSAALCLGALQSMGVYCRTVGGVEEKEPVFRSVDYLSTVSGGGYIGASLSAAMAKTGEFPFSAPYKFVDQAAVAHLRDYSNYILPRGHKTFLDAISVVLRGLAANLLIIGALVFVASAITAIVYPYRVVLSGGAPYSISRGLAKLGQFFHVSALSQWMTPIVPDHWFYLTRWSLGLALVWFAVWAVLRSRKHDPGADVRGPGIWRSGVVIWVVLICAALDLQPLLLELYFQFAIWARSHDHGDMIKSLTAAATAVGAVVAFFHDKLAFLLKSTGDDKGVGVLAKRVLAFTAIWVAAMVLPALIVFFYLAVATAAMHDGYSFSALPIDVRTGVLQVWPHIHVVWSYLAIGIITSVGTAFLSPNANSLHRLYRDKLSKAFLFDPDVRCVAPQSPDYNDLAPLDDTKLTELSGANGGPYHLINAALNVQDSAEANKRGRNADFFLFSPKFVGSAVTGYTAAGMCAVDLGTAMAVSGAAVSSNMGRFSIPALAPTLALLNIRLGFWMHNFSAMVEDLKWSTRLRHLGRKIFKYYLLEEALGLLNETSPLLYLTDGGHIENLGLYQLLKRRCKLIIVIDGEADPSMSFAALSLAERYARTDFGTRVNLPWQPIAIRSRAAEKELDSDDGVSDSEAGPHCALGIIDYPADSDTTRRQQANRSDYQGVLLYVKASVTGDEPDYVMDYKKRQRSFPHESTGDQFFSEEQFEAYRALGFHALFGFLAGQHRYAVATGPGPWGTQDPREYVLDLMK